MLTLDANWRNGLREESQSHTIMAWGFSFTYNSPTTWLSVVDTEADWKAEHALEPWSDRHPDMAAGGRRRGPAEWLQCPGVLACFRTVFDLGPLKRPLPISFQSLGWCQLALGCR
jgi:hypothetical protein